MKNLYLFIIVCLSMTSAFAQDLQNANWVLNSTFGVTFNTDPISLMPSPAGTPDYIVHEGIATLSDNNGNLLLFTNGHAIWRRMGDGTIVQVESGLFGDASSSQNVVIVHRPGHPNNYYIFTNNGWSGNQSNLGAYYSEIELTPTNTITHFKNYPLNAYDRVGGVITDNTSEAITCSRHPDGFSYWVSFGVDSPSANKHEIWSYRVLENGVQPIPDQISTLPLQQSHSLTMCFKIKDDRIAVGSYSEGAYLGTFNSYTGQVVVNGIPVGDSTTTVGGCKALEFSPSGNYLYSMYSTFGTYYQGKLLCFNVNNPNVVIIPNIGSTESVQGVQIGIDNKIYLRNLGPSIRTISNPDTPSNLITQTLFGDSNCTNGAFCSSRLPQLVQIQPLSQPCLIDVFTNSTIDSPHQENLEAEESIVAQANFNIGTSGIYHAGNSVSLLPGFNAEKGSTFSAYIEGCTYSAAPLSSPSSFERTANVTQENFISNELKKEYVIISPNPSSESVEISLESLKMNGIMVTSMDGRIMFTKNVRDIASYRLDISNYTKGIYMVTVTTTNGKTITGKIIKN